MALQKCSHDHVASETEMADLPMSQAGPGRHCCAVCAYALGLAEADRDGPRDTCVHGKAAPKSVTTTLPKSQAGEARHRCVTCAYAAGLKARERSAESGPDEIVEMSGVYPEGTLRQVTVNQVERNPAARRRCLDHYGYACVACGMKLDERYGEAARDLIHVHHVRPLAGVVGPYNIDPVEDLRPVCPNCHAVIHRSVPPYTIEDVRKMLR